MKNHQQGEEIIKVWQKNVVRYRTASSGESLKRESVKKYSSDYLQTNKFLMLKQRQNENYVLAGTIRNEA